MKVIQFEELWPFESPHEPNGWEVAEVHKMAPWFRISSEVVWDGMEVEEGVVTRFKNQEMYTKEKGFVRRVLLDPRLMRTTDIPGRTHLRVVK